MEAHSSSTVEDGLLDSLNFKPSGQSAQYVLQSRKVKIFAEASDTFGINSRVIRFRLTEQDFWEPGSTRIEFTLHNEDTHPLIPVAPPGAMFSRYRIFISGIQVENWDYVGETCVLMDRLKGAARRLNDSTEHHFLSNGYNDTYSPIAVGKARRVVMTLPCGLVQSDRWVPLSLCSGGVTIEMELSSDVGQAFDASNTPAWSIKDVALSCTLLQIDQSLSSSLRATQNTCFLAIQLAIIQNPW